MQFYFVGFVKYGLVFVTYGVKKDSFEFCHIWVGFVTCGVRKDTFGICQIWAWFCHIWVDFVMGYVIYGQYSTATIIFDQWEVRLG